MIHKAQSIGDLLAEFIRGTEAEITLLERKIPQVWSELMGDVVVQFTGEMEVKNDKVGSAVVKDIRLLG